MLSWGFLYKKSQRSGLNFFILKSFFILIIIYNIWNLMMLLSRNQGEIYLFFWSVITIFQAYFIVYSFLKYIKLDYPYLPLAVTSFFAIPVIISAIISYIGKSYDPVNKIDFYLMILLSIISFINLRFILLKESFIENIESFFIFFGFIFYFGLHILACNTSMLDFLENWNISQNATMISLIFWLGSVFIIWKIKSRNR